jgi:hypothetical protein
MKRIVRDPEKFEILRLYQTIGLKRNFKLLEKKSVKTFLHELAASIDRCKSPILLHGSRVEAMFGYVAASLGHCILGPFRVRSLLLQYVLFSANLTSCHALSA